MMCVCQRTRLRLRFFRFRTLFGVGFAVVLCLWLWLSTQRSQQSLRVSHRHRHRIRNGNGNLYMYSFGVGPQMDAVEFEAEVEVETRARHNSTQHQLQPPAVFNFVILVPFRNRDRHLAQFSNYVSDYISKHDPHLRLLEIICIEQTDSLPFNRGALFNIGFLRMSRKYNSNRTTNGTSTGRVDWFAMHDVDWIPTPPISYYPMFYRHHPHPHTYTHSNEQLRPQHILPAPPLYSTNIGGVLCMSARDFELCLNGYDNAFWGWGGEDDCLYSRLRQMNGTSVEYQPQPQPQPPPSAPQQQYSRHVRHRWTPPAPQPVRESETETDHGNENKSNTSDSDSDSDHSWISYNCDLLPATNSGTVFRDDRPEIRQRTRKHNAQNMLANEHHTRAVKNESRHKHNIQLHINARAENADSLLYLQTHGLNHMPEYHVLSEEQFGILTILKVSLKRK